MFYKKIVFLCLLIVSSHLFAENKILVGHQFSLIENHQDLKLIVKNESEYKCQLKINLKKIEAKTKSRSLLLDKSAGNQYSKVIVILANQEREVNFGKLSSKRPKALKTQTSISQCNFKGKIYESAYLVNPKNKRPGFNELKINSKLVNKTLYLNITNNSDSVYYSYFYLAAISTKDGTVIAKSSNKNFYEFLFKGESFSTKLDLPSKLPKGKYFISVIIYNEGGNRRSFRQALKVVK